jgi:hypothetical protein
MAIDNPFSNVPNAQVKVDDWVIRLLQSTPQLKAIYDQVRNPETGEFSYSADYIARLIQNSDWYLQNGPTVAAQVGARVKYGEKYFQDEVNKYKTSISSLAKTIGLNMADPIVAGQIAVFAESAYYNQWDAANLENQLVKQLGSMAQGGAYATMAQDISDYANLMGFVPSEKDKKSYQTRLLGTVDPVSGLRLRSTADEIKAEIRANSAKTYAVYSDQINAGSTLWDLTSAQRKRAASLLEIDEKSLSWNDPLLKDGKLFVSVDKETGKLAQRPVWDVDAMVRQDERWQYTNNARATYDKFTYELGRRMGKIG